jgi:hypothetical protein
LLFTSEYYAFKNTLQLSYTTEEFPEIQNLREMFEWIENNINEPTRIYYQSTYESGISDKPWFDQSKFMPFAIYYTKKPSLGTWSIGMPYPTQKNIVTTGNILFNKPIKDITPEYIAYNLEKFNAKYIVVLTNSSKKVLDSNTSLFKLYKQFGRFSIYSLNNYTPSYIYIYTDGNVELIKFSDDEIEFTITNTTSVDVKVQYHPYWLVFIDGKRAPIEKNEVNLIKIRLPNKDRHHVYMIFRQPTFRGVLLSIIGYLLLVILLITYKRN